MSHFHSRSERDVNSDKGLDSLALQKHLDESCCSHPKNKPIVVLTSCPKDSGWSDMPRDALWNHQRCTLGQGRRYSSPEHWPGLLAQTHYPTNQEKKRSHQSNISQICTFIWWNPTSQLGEFVMNDFLFSTIFSGEVIWRLSPTEQTLPLEIHSSRCHSVDLPRLFQSR